MKTDPQRNAFEKALLETPLDSLTRGVYADWLEEQGLDDEAQRQRDWTPAYDFLKKFADPYALYVDEDTPTPKGYVYADVMREIEGWKEQIQREGNVIFGSNYCQDTLHDPEIKEKFWRAFEVITGVSPPLKLRQREWYGCAC